jgi:DNA-binding NarL/FixJ family response regulator
MKIAFIISDQLKALEQQRSTFCSLNFVSICDFYSESNIDEISKKAYDFVFYDTEAEDIQNKRLYKEFVRLVNKPTVILIATNGTVVNFQKIHKHGISYISPTELNAEEMSCMIAYLLQTFAPNRPALKKAEPSNNYYNLLTQREKQLLNLFTTGVSYKEAGHQLGLKLPTIQSHIRNIYRKLNVNSKTEAVLKVMAETYN